jgi:hypothetical protein
MFGTFCSGPTPGLSAVHSARGRHEHTLMRKPNTSSDGCDTQAGPIRSSPGRRVWPGQDADHGLPADKDVARGTISAVMPDTFRMPQCTCQRVEHAHLRASCIHGLAGPRQRPVWDTVGSNLFSALPGECR